MSSLPPLRKKTVDGKLYKRRAATEILIHKCLELTFDELCDRAEISARTHDDYIPSEVLVYFLRQTKTHNNDAQFGSLYQLLEKRIRRVCPHSKVRLGEKEGTIGHLQDVQDFVLDDFAVRVMRDRQEYEEKLDIFEYAFDKAVARRKHDAMRVMYQRDKPTEPLQYDEDGDIPADVEGALAKLNPNKNSPEDEITYRFQLQRAIDTLPDDERRVINMIFAGIPSESNDPEVQTISTILQCKPQTVRNRRDRAVAKLQQILGTEVKDVN